MIENRFTAGLMGGIIDDPELGTIQAYREYIAAIDAIEYTVFFRIDGTKFRLDLRINCEDIYAMEDPEAGVRQLILDDIAAGNYVVATEVPRND